MENHRIARIAAAVGLFGAVMGGASFPMAATAAGPALAAEALGPAIMMGVAVAAATQTATQQDLDRAALRKRLQWLAAHRLSDPMGYGSADREPHLVRIVFDVDANGRTTNVRVGKRSGYAAGDQRVVRQVARFDGLPGGERRRVCLLLHYGHPAEMNYDAFARAMRAEQASAVADLSAGRDGPQYDGRGRVIA